MNLPNRITLGRFFLTIGYFVILHWIEPRAAGSGPRVAVVGALTWADLAVGFFLITALSDILDGYIARRYGLVTDFGRLADPLVDKVVICGSFILLLRYPVIVREGVLEAWMAVVVVTREFLVTGIRSLVEARGVAFPATFWGKQKMLVQCVAVTAMLLLLGRLSGTSWGVPVVRALVWLAVLSTAVSGVFYASQARSVFVRKAA